MQEIETACGQYNNNQAMAEVKHKTNEKGIGRKGKEQILSRLKRTCTENVSFEGVSQTSGWTSVGLLEMSSKDSSGKVSGRATNLSNAVRPARGK